MISRICLILILIIVSMHVNAQKTQLIFVDELKVTYSKNPSNSNKPFSFNLVKNNKCVLRNNRADTLKHFNFDLDTLTAISFEFPSDTILIPNACKYWGNIAFGNIELIPNNKTNCILIEFNNFSSPEENLQDIIPSSGEYPNPNCDQYKYFFSSLTEQNSNYIKHIKGYTKLK